MNQFIARGVQNSTRFWPSAKVTVMRIQRRGIRVADQVGSTSRSQCR
ncbi:hypothetical protein [Sulfuricella sp. T08]|nr:hypothetical protein [Sulfuricella sp. T08]